MLSIRELKRRYRRELALGRVLPTHDRAIPLPFSTGVPLYDAALTSPLKATATRNEPEQLGWARALLRGSTERERETLTANARLLLNDHRALLALECWQRGEDERTARLLATLPWHWRLGFPIAVIKPAAWFFTGWRKTLRFRLLDDPRFPALRALFRDTLAAAPPVAILKYRATIQAAAALLAFRFEGDRERAIHDVCFANGRGDAARIAALEPIGTYLRARDALRTTGVPAMLDVLTSAAREIPITSYMGLLGGAKVKLTASGPYAAALRDYAVRCATPVESLLRIAEWAPWLEERHAGWLAANVRNGVIERGLDIPFFKVLKAFEKAPPGPKKMLLRPLLLPLMRHFGERVAQRLDGELAFVQPGNHLHVLSFLLYATVASVTPARLILANEGGAHEIDPIPLEEVGAHLADAPHELEQWLLARFGAQTQQRTYRYDFAALGRTLGALDPSTPVMLDLPFVESEELLDALLPFERVFNLNHALGAPGEVCVAYEYYQHLYLGGRDWSFAIWSRWSDGAARRFAECLDTLGAFQRLGEAA